MMGLRSTIIAGVVALLLGLLLLGQCQKARTAGAEAAVSAKTGEAATVSGQAAVEAVGGVSARQSDIDQTTRENDAQIHAAAGADQLVNPAVADAGLIGLCRRAAYRGDPKCLRFTPAGRVAPTGAGGGAAP